MGGNGRGEKELAGRGRIVGNYHRSFGLLAENEERQGGKKNDDKNGNKDGLVLGHGCFGHL